MIDFSKYGFRSRNAFIKATGISQELFNSIANDPDWNVAKSVLKHPECPLELRNRFAADPIWYRRLVAMFSKHAPDGYWRQAVNDPDKRVRNAYDLAREAELHPLSSQ